MKTAFGGFYRGRKVFVTGHTGFKGSWLCLWLRALGAEVMGYALDPPTQPANFEACALAGHIHHVPGDVRDHAHLRRMIADFQPEVVFHLAAQALVRESIRNPRETFDVNLMGTVNLLDAALQCDAVQAVVSITSDKCYRNLGWEWGYREVDTLGGEEAYSASKACAELAIAAYQSRDFQAARQRRGYLPIASVRAGNVIGGGDWARERLIPDVVRALSEGRPVILRSPQATRPWQHVLEPLSGYLWLGAHVGNDPDRYVSGWNFGPVDLGVHAVLEVVEKMLACWPAPRTEVVIEPNPGAKEAMLLALDCAKARSHLKWNGTWFIDETIAATAAWYKAYYDADGADMYEFTQHQIEDYTAIARARGQAWAQGQLLGG